MKFSAPRILALLFLLCCASFEPVMAQALPKCNVAGITPDGEGNMAFAIQGDKDFYVGNAQFVLHIGKAAFSLNTQDGPMLIFYIPLAAFNQLAEGEQMYLNYGDAQAAEDEELLADACRHKSVNTCSLGLFTRDLLRR
jgi:hypothetical protein